MIYEVLYKTLIDPKNFLVMLDKVDWFIRDYNGTRYLILFGTENYSAIFDRIRYLIRLTIDISYVVSHNYAKITIDLDDDLPFEETLTFYNAVIFMKPDLKKNQNHYYKNMF